MKDQRYNQPVARIRAQKTSGKTTRTPILMAAALACLLLGALAPTAAQAQPVDALASWNSGPAASGADSSPDQAPAGPAAANAAPASAGNWHVDATTYLWFSGAHGNLAAFGYNLGFKASISDLLSKFRFGITEIVDVRYKRLVLTSDLLWMTLSNTNTRTLLFPTAPQRSAQLSAELVSRTVLFTQKIGFRLVENGKVNIDGLTGFRFWHLGDTLTITPSPRGNNLYASKNWVDPLVGARIQVPLSPKLLATIAGDVGGWGAGSQLDYQIVGALGYKIKPKLALDAAWRYLYLDYGQYPFTTQVALSGPVLGLTYSFLRPD
jgi:hypothetical protein